jgi:hypothetical protein
MQNSNSWVEDPFLPLTPRNSQQLDWTPLLPQPIKLLPKQRYNQTNEAKKSNFWNGRKKKQTERDGYLPTKGGRS